MHARQHSKQRDALSHLQKCAQALQLAGYLLRLAKPAPGPVGSMEKLTESPALMIVTVDSRYTAAVQHLRWADGVEPVEGLAGIPDWCMVLMSSALRGVTTGTVTRTSSEAPTIAAAELCYRVPCSSTSSTRGGGGQAYLMKW